MIYNLAFCLLDFLPPLPTTHFGIHGHAGNFDRVPDQGGPAETAREHPRKTPAPTAALHWHCCRSQRDASRAIALLTFFGGIGGFLFGYDTGVISGALPYLRDDLLRDYASDVSRCVGAPALCQCIDSASRGSRPAKCHTSESPLQCKHKHTLNI